MSRPNEPCVLIVDDDASGRALLAGALQRIGIAAHSAADGMEALDLLRLCDYAVIVTEVAMARLNGPDLVRGLADDERHKRTVILFSSSLDHDRIVELAPPNVHAIIRKPFDPDEIAPLFADLLREWKNHHVESSERQIELR